MTLSQVSLALQRCPVGTRPRAGLCTILCVSLAALLALAIPGLALCQVLTGTVTNTTGVPLAGARIEAVSAGTGETVAVDTVRNSAGHYRLVISSAGVPLVTYIVTACATNHIASASWIPLARRDTASVDVRLVPSRHSTAATPRAGASAPITPSRCPREIDALSRFYGRDAGTRVSRALAFRASLDSLSDRYRRLVGVYEGAPARPAIPPPVALAERTATLRMLDTKFGSMLASTAHARHKVRAAPAELESAALLELLYAARTGALLDSTSRARLRAALPPASYWWAVVPSEVLSATVMFWPDGIFGVEGRRHGAGVAAADRYLEAVHDGAVELDVRANALAALIQVVSMQGDELTARRLFAQLQHEAPTFNVTRTLAQFYDPTTRLLPGARMPAFAFQEIPDTTQAVTNASIAGHYTLIDFWGTWCGPCIEAMPALDALYRSYHPRGLEVLSVAADSPESVAAFRAERWPMPWRNAVAPGGMESAMLKQLGVASFPQSMLVGPDGVIIAAERSPGAALARQTLDRVLPLRDGATSPAQHPRKN